MEAPGQMKVIVVIASPTRGFATPEADTPPVIRPYAAPLQDQDEKGSFNSLGFNVVLCGESPQPGLTVKYRRWMSLFCGLKYLLGSTSEELVLKIMAEIVPTHAQRSGGMLLPDAPCLTATLVCKAKESS